MNANSDKDGCRDCLALDWHPVLHLHVLAVSRMEPTKNTAAPSRSRAQDQTPSYTCNRQLTDLDRTRGSDLILSRPFLLTKFPLHCRPSAGRNSTRNRIPCSRPISRKASGQQPRAQSHQACAFYALERSEHKAVTATPFACQEQSTLTMFDFPPHIPCGSWQPRMRRRLSISLPRTAR
jgi:hypothetical protein